MRDFLDAVLDVLLHPLWLVYRSAIDDERGGEE